MNVYVLLMFFWLDSKYYLANTGGVFTTETNCHKTAEQFEKRWKDRGHSEEVTHKCIFERIE